MTLLVEPRPAERPRFGRGFTYTAPKSRAYKWMIQNLAAPYRQNPLKSGPLKLTAKFILKKPARPKFKQLPAVKPDLDNLMKSLKDALNGILWTDDALICEYGAGTGKYYALDGSTPRIELCVEDLSI